METALPQCSPVGQWGGSQASSLDRWDLTSAGIQKSALSEQRRTAHEVHCKTGKNTALSSAVFSQGQPDFTSSIALVSLCRHQAWYFSQQVQQGFPLKVSSTHIILYQTTCTWGFWAIWTQKHCSYPIYSTDIQDMSQSTVPLRSFLLLRTSQVLPSPH